MKCFGKVTLTRWWPSLLLHWRVTETSVKLQKLRNSEVIFCLIFFHQSIVHLVLLAWQFAILVSSCLASEQTYIYIMFTYVRFAWHFVTFAWSRWLDQKSLYAVTVRNNHLTYSTCRSNYRNIYVHSRVEVSVSLFVFSLRKHDLLKFETWSNHLAVRMSLYCKWLSHSIWWLLNLVLLYFVRCIILPIAYF